MKELSLNKEAEITSLIEKSYQELVQTQSSEETEKKYLAKGGIFSQLFSQLIQLEDPKEKRKIGDLLNNWKKELTKRIEIIKLEGRGGKAQKNEKKNEPDIYLEGKKIPLANLHPLTQLIQKVYDIFLRLGYQIVESPEIETEENNFTLLNMPANHPARDMHDTFYLNDNWLLRTHTTTIQPWVMKKNLNKELRIISAGKVYRRDEDDATHTHQFTQVDCFAVGKNISFSHLKSTIELVTKELLGKEANIRFRPSYFPFTEPSVEVDATCTRCQGKECSVCKGTGWVEIAGAGLIHPQVLKNCGFNNQKFSGFAFAFGLERLLMIRYGIEDIRHFYLNDVRFLRQFRNY